MAAATRFKHMGMDEDQINTCLKAMRAERVQYTYKIGDREYDVFVE